MIAIQIPDDATLLEAATQAAAKHLHLITNGTRTVLSPVVLPGFHKIAVKSRPMPLTAQSDH